MKTIYLIDGYSFLYRAYHVMPPLTNPQNIPIGAVYGFTKMLLRLLDAHKPDYAVVAYDNPTTTLRKQIYPLYKGNRTKRDDLQPQFAIARDASTALGFLNLEAGGYEADDIIATLARRAELAGLKVVIVSSDKDLMQLVSENVTMYDSMQEKYYDIQAVWEKFGVRPNKLAEVLALTGDVADNIPGVPRIGVTTAARLINEFGSLDAVLEQTDNITQNAVRNSIEKNRDSARLSHKLVTLYYDVPIYLEFEDMQVLFNREKVTDFCMLHDFASLIGR